MREAILAAVVVAVLGGLGLGTYDPPSSQVEGGIPEAEPVAQMQPVEIVPDEEPQDDAWTADEEWYEPEPVYYEEPAYSEPEPVYSGEAPDLRSMGVVDSGGETYTWYSERTLPGGGLTDLNSSGRTTNDDGFVVDGDGYLAVASPDESVPIGTEVDTPWGKGRVYDYNPGSSWDMYTSW